MLSRPPPLHYFFIFSYMKYSNYCSCQKDILVNLQASTLSPEKPFSEMCLSVNSITQKRAELDR